uniref:Peptidase M13 N-terminal domain-containing protein n=1 Tax=Stomoxys calcitrans TaxID=35570 RepID=A0A1I8Q3F2_STOCA
MNWLALWSAVAFLFGSLITLTQSDRVALLECEAKSSCLAHVDEAVLEVIREHMYNTSDACDNFWDYACGSWTEGPYYDHVDTLGAMTNHYADKLKVIVEILKTAAEDPEDNTLMVNKIWRYYESCSASGNYYLEVAEYLKELPMHQVWGEQFQWHSMFNKTSFAEHNIDWLTLMATLRPYGLNGIFFKESMGFASNDSWKNVLEIKIPTARKRFRSKYKILEILEEYHFEAYASSEELWLLAEDLYAFDKDMVELYRGYEETGKNVKSLTMEELLNADTLLPWQKYFDLLIGKHLDPRLVSLEIAGKLDYFTNLHEQLQQKDGQIVFWYIIVNFCQHLLDIKPLITDRNCLLHTNVMFPLGLNYIYDRFLYKNRQKDEKVLQDMLSGLKGQFAVYVEENKFQLSNEEIGYLKAKVSAIQLQIGNLPSHIPHLNEYYSPIELSPTNFYANHMKMLKFRFLQQHLSVWNPKRLYLLPEDYYVNDDISTPRNAPYFIHPRNLLMIPMVFLQLPFYHHSQNPIFHHSLVGWIMAHELSHGFDSHGLAFDANGNYSPLGYQISLKSSFVHTLECLTKSSATLSLNERMADVNGLQLVWDLYTQNFPQNSTDLSLDLSSEEIFFLNLAQFFCGSLPPTTAHDRDDVRVKETLRNLKEFLHIFGCEKAARNFSKTSCDIWRN